MEKKKKNIQATNNWLSRPEGRKLGDDSGEKEIKQEGFTQQEVSGQGKMRGWVF